MGVKSPGKIDVEVGLRIRVQRQTASLSQTALASQLGVTFQQVQKYEKGVNRIGAGRLTKIAQVLNVPIAALLGTDEDNVAMHGGPHGGESPLKLLTVSGALRLLRAYGRLTDRVTRQSVVRVVERVADQPVGRSKKH
jgi:transcriptional regulator with XRE-family HTH domain